MLALTAIRVDGIAHAPIRIDAVRPANPATRLTLAATAQHTRIQVLALPASQQLKVHGVWLDQVECIDSGIAGHVAAFAISLARRMRATRKVAERRHV